MKGRSTGAARAVNYATSPLLASKTPPWRSRFVVVLMALGFLVLAGRAVYIQLVDVNFFVQQGEKRHARTFVLPASRGRILDRNGVVLAASVPAPSISVVPRDFEADVAQRRALARTLGISLGELEERTAGDKEFAWLRRQVDDAVWDAVKAMDLKGVHQVREYRRRYPDGEASAHVVGFTGVEEDGQEGIELAFQKDLRGRAGSRRVLRDRLGNVIEDLGARVEPVHGRDVRLSLDSKVQFFAYQRLRDAVAEHGARAGSVVVLDERSGEQLRNRAITDIFEPGSTMKPFVAALALQSGRVTPETRIDTAPGQITVTGSTIKDAHPHGVLTVAEVIQKSSNVGTVKMAQQMPAQEMWELYSQVGFGQKPQVDFPGAVTGKLRAWKTWRPIEQATMSYGYGISASLLQLARAYTVFARDGDIVPVTLLRREERAAGMRVLSPATAQQVRLMLRAAAGPGGTAPKAQAIGYSVGGKTGTARKNEGRGYTTNKYRAWFVGLAPVSDPRIVVAVMVDEPSRGVFYGGDVAAPVFSQVVQQTLRTLGVPTDIEVRPQIVVKPGAAEAESF